MNSNNRELKWKLVKKGRSARRLSRRRWDSATKLGKLPSPKRVGDFSGSDSEKFGECFLGQSSPSNMENVPIKKRHCFPSFSFEQNKQLVCPRSHSGDFSGIELLATAAASMTMNDDFNSGDKESPVLEDSSLKSRTIGSSISASSSEICLKSFESERGSTEGPRVASASQSPCRNTDGGVLMKSVNRMHWDLNLPMDAWGEPYDSESKDDINMGTAQKESSDSVLPTAFGDTSAELFDVKLEASGSIFSSQVKTESESSGGTEAFDVKEEARVPIFSSQVKTETESSGTIKDQILFCDSIKEDENHARSVCDAVDISKDEAVDLQFQDSKSSCIQDGQSLLTCDSNPLEEPRKSIDSLADEPTHSDGMFDFAKKSQQASDASQACDFVDGSNLSVIKEGYNSPYEDGEVRGSYLHSSDENEYVNYESDGRNEHETDVTNCHELAQVGSEVCHGAKLTEAGPWTRSERSVEFTEKNVHSRKRSVMIRSSIEDEEPYRARRRMSSTQEVHWFPRSSGRDHSFPLDSGRSSRKHFPQRTHFGSRTWNYTSSRRQSQSPDYRSENRMERIRVQRSKQGWTPGYGDGYMPASRDSLNKYRSFKYSAFPEKQVKRRRSPIRSFKRSQRYDTIHFKSDEYHRSVNRSG